MTLTSDDITLRLVVMTLIVESYQEISLGVMSSTNS